MSTSNDVILDRYIKHQTYLMRYAGGLRNIVTPRLLETEKGLYDDVVKWISKTDDNRTLTGKAGRKWQKDFEKVIRDRREPAWDSIYDKIDEELKELAIIEAGVAAKIIDDASPVILDMKLPPVEQLVAIVNSQPFEGRTLKNWVKRTSEADVSRFLTNAKIGVIQGQTPTQIARDLLGTPKFKRRDAKTRKAFRDIESVILTLTNGVQNEAKQALYKANSDVIQKEKFVATLDARTTLVCASNDNKVFNSGEGPIPPLHFRCRSMRVPYLRYGEIGERGFDPTTEEDLLDEYAKSANIDKVKTRGDLPRGYKTKYDKFARKRKRELIGREPVTKSYNEWLKDQSVAFQNRVLGKTRAIMFRKGDITLDKFVARNGDTITLDELSRS